MEQQCELPYRQYELVNMWMYGTYPSTFIEDTWECYRLKNWEVFLVVLSYYDVFEEWGDFGRYSPNSTISSDLSKAVFLVNSRDAVLVGYPYDKDLLSVKLSRSGKSLVFKTREQVSWSHEPVYIEVTRLFDLKTGLPR